LSRNFDKTLILYLNTSWLFAGVLLGLHAGALAIAVAVPIPWGARIALAALIGLSAYHAVRRHALHRGKSAVQAVELDSTGDWRLSMGSRNTLGPCRLLACYVHPWLVVVHLRCQARRWPVGLVLTADAVDPELLRALRVRLGTQRGVG
jgi:toxin CptA